MDPGELNRKIVIQRFTTSKNDFNEDLKTWANHAEPWAKIADLSSREIYSYFEGKAERSKKVTRFTVYRSSETESASAADKIVYSSKEYKILTTRDIDDERFIEILAEANLV